METLTKKDSDGFEFVLEWTDKPWCEQCGELEPFTLTFDSDGVYWCIDCSVSQGIYLTSQDIIDLDKTEKEKKIKYFQKRIEELKRYGK